MKDKHCCDILKYSLSLFYWMTYIDYEDEGKIKYIMPYIYDKEKEKKYRVNHCPSCGANIRDIELTEI